MHSGTRVGFVGLGRMGRPMAGNLLQGGCQLVVHDLDPLAARECLEAGATWAATPAELAARCDVILTSLPTPPDVEVVLTGPAGLLDGARTGTAVFDLSTNSVAVVRQVHERCRKADVDFLDAPVSGGVEGARTRRLAIWVGGDGAVFARHEPMLRLMGDEVRHIGPIGAGNIAKLVHNCASAMVATALAEVFSLGIKAGLEPMPLWEAVRQGATGRRRTSDGLGAEFLTGQYEKPGFPLRLMHKDVDLAVALGEQVGVPLHIARYTLDELAAARERGWDDLASRVAMRLQLERAAVAEPAIPPEQVAAILAHQN